mmetsp:Transcript_83702/g.167637  ORF Transcript_83702/g.167637 Transcript_83702/m.167637 type:complete len:349 (-) Transcript_83702:423-1469(-)
MEPQEGQSWRSLVSSSLKGFAHSMHSSTRPEWIPRFTCLVVSSFFASPPKLAMLMFSGHELRSTTPHAGGGRRVVNAPPPPPLAPASSSSSSLPPLVDEGSDRITSPADEYAAVRDPKPPLLEGAAGGDGDEGGLGSAGVSIPRSPPPPFFSPLPKPPPFAAAARALSAVSSKTGFAAAASALLVNTASTTVPSVLTPARPPSHCGRFSKSRKSCMNSSGLTPITPSVFRLAKLPLGRVRVHTRVRTVCPGKGPGLVDTFTSSHPSQCGLTCSRTLLRSSSNATPRRATLGACSSVSKYSAKDKSSTSELCAVWGAKPQVRPSGLTPGWPRVPRDTSLSEACFASSSP